MDTVFNAAVYSTNYQLAGLTTEIYLGAWFVRAECIATNFKNGLPLSEPFRCVRCVSKGDIEKLVAGGRVFFREELARPALEPEVASEEL